MKKTWFALVVILSAVTQVRPAFAGDSFSADMVMHSAAQEIHGKIYFATGKIRFEMAENIMITRLDLKVTWVIMPGQGIYMEQPMDPKAAVSGSREVPGETERTSMGKETVNGRSCEKFKVSYAQNGKTESIYQWIADDVTLPVRVAAADDTWSVDYLNIQTGSQPDSLFEIPQGYQKLAIPSLADIGAQPPQE